AENPGSWGGESGRMLPAPPWSLRTGSPRSPRWPRRQIPRTHPAWQEWLCARRAGCSGMDRPPRTCRAHPNAARSPAKSPERRSRGSDWRMPSSGWIQPFRHRPRLSRGVQPGPRARLGFDLSGEFALSGGSRRQTGFDVQREAPQFLEAAVPDAVFAVGVFGGDRQKVRDGRTVLANALSQILPVGPQRVFWMHAHRPDAKRRPPESPQLLGNPKHTVGIAVRVQGHPVADGLDSQTGKRSDRISIKRVCRRNPQIGTNPLACEDLQAALEFRVLFFQRQPGEFAVAVQADDSRFFVDVAMLVTVKANRPAARLPGAHLIPKAFVRLAFIQSRILIVGHHGQNGLDRFVEHDGLELAPALPVYSRAQIVEAKQEFDSHELPAFAANPFRLRCGPELKLSVPRFACRRKRRRPRGDGPVYFPVRVSLMQTLCVARARTGTSAPPTFGAASCAGPSGVRATSGGSAPPRDNLLGVILFPPVAPPPRPALARAAIHEWESQIRACAGRPEPWERICKATVVADPCRSCLAVSSKGAAATQTRLCDGPAAGRE